MARNPGIFSTLKTTDTTATSLCIGCAVGSTTAAANSGLKVATISVESLTAPSVTTNKLYNVSGSLTWNGSTLATGSTISGTTGTIGKFTGVAAMGDSLLTQSGTTVTMAGTLAATTLSISGTATAGTFSGSGASLTSIPTSAVSSGNFVATAASGTGITSSATSGNAAATTISLNNTAVTPASYGVGTGASFTVDQQGRLTLAANATITSLGTVTTGVWNAGAVTSSGIVTGTVLHPTAAPAAAGSVGFSANTLVFQGGTSGHQWADSTNANARMTLTDLGALVAASTIKATGQPGFLATNTVSDLTQASGAVVDFDTEVYDELGNFASDTFTAPVTGRYLLATTVFIGNASANISLLVKLVTTNRTYTFASEAITTGAANKAYSTTVCADMTAADTAQVTIALTSGTVTIQGDALYSTVFSGRLLP